MERISIFITITICLLMGSGYAQSSQNLGVVTLNMEGVVPIITFGDLVIEFAEHIGTAALK